jgi:predicted nucleic acid-binding protein
MRLLDANVFIRYLTGDDPIKQGASKLLFERLDRDEEQLLTSEAVVAEIIYVLTSRAHYGLTREAAAQRLLPALRSPGLRIANKTVVLRALDVYEAHSRLDYEDALSVAHMESAGIDEIYTYNKDFDQVPGVVHVEPQMAP